MENILPRREARENAFLLAFSQTFGDIPLQEALDNHHECDEEHQRDAYIMEVVAVGDDQEEFVPVAEELADKLIEIVQNGLFEDDEDDDEE